MIEPSAYVYDVTTLAAADGGGFLVTFPDIPGVIGIGENRQEAVADGQQALLACLDALKAVDRDPPAPSAIRRMAPLA